MSYDHHHPHQHEAVSHNRAFFIGVVLNLLFVLIESTYGVLTNSLALIADAGHNLSDVVSLLLAWGASFLATKPATLKRTYGFRKATVMASLASSILLLIAIGGISLEAIQRLFTPKPVEGLTVVVVAAIGVVINTATALLFVKGKEHDLNIKAAFLHMAADAGISLGVVIAGVLIITLGWVWIDPVMSIFIALIILIGTWRLLRDSLNYAMDAVPGHIDVQTIRQYLLEFDHVNDLHDLHVWPLSTTEVALTVHIVVNHNVLENDFLNRLQKHLHDHFGIDHTTIQIETSKTENSCLLV